MGLALLAFLLLGGAAGEAPDRPGVVRAPGARVVKQGRKERGVAGVRLEVPDFVRVREDATRVGNDGAEVEPDAAADEEADEWLATE